MPRYPNTNASTTGTNAFAALADDGTDDDEDDGSSTHCDEEENHSLFHPSKWGSESFISGQMIVKPPDASQGHDKQKNDQTGNGATETRLSQRNENVASEITVHLAQKPSDNTVDLLDSENPRIKYKENTPMNHPQNVQQQQPQPSEADESLDIFFNPSRAPPPETGWQVQQRTRPSTSPKANPPKIQAVQPSSWRSIRGGKNFNPREQTPRKTYSLAGGKAFAAPSSQAPSNKGAAHTRTQISNGRRRLAPQTLVEPDNAAVTAYRRGEKFKRTVYVPDVRGSGRDARSTANDTISNYIDRIARDTQTFIKPGVYLRDKRARLWQIWGSEERADEALRLIKTRIADLQLDTSNKAKNWAKIKSLSEKQLANEERKRQRAETLQQYKRLVLPEDAAQFQSTKTVSWTSTSIPLLNILGRNLEALDPVRATCRCFILPAKGIPCPGIVVWSNDESGLQAAVKKIETAFTQIRNRYFIPPEYFLIKVSSHQALKQSVQLAPYYGPLISGKSHSEPKSIGCSVRFAGEHLESSELPARQALDNRFCVRADTLECEKPNLLFLEAVTMETLKRVQVYAGSLQMRARLGSLVLDRYKRTANNMYNLGDFEEMLDDYNNDEGGIQPNFRKELGNVELESQILQRFKQAVGLSMSTPRPIYSWIAVLSNNNEEAGDYRLEVEYHQNARNGKYEKSNTKWERLEQGCTERSALMEVNFVDLEDGCSYQLGITSAYTVDYERMLPQYRKFAESIGFSPASADSKATGFPSVKADWHFLPSEEGPKFASHKCSWNFRFKDSEYVVEICRFQDEERTEDRRGRAQAVTYEPRWSVALFHPQWDVLLSSNANVGIGEKAAWLPVEETFFPPTDGVFRTDESGRLECHYEGDGFAELARRLQMVEDIVLGREQPRFQISPIESEKRTARSSKDNKEGEKKNDEKGKRVDKRSDANEKGKAGKSGEASKLGKAKTSSRGDEVGEANKYERTSKGNKGSKENKSAKANETATLPSMVLEAGQDRNANSPDESKVAEDDQSADTTSIIARSLLDTPNLDTNVEISESTSSTDSALTNRGAASSSAAHSATTDVTKPTNKNPTKTGGNRRCTKKRNKSNKFKNKGRK